MRIGQVYSRGQAGPPVDPTSWSDEGGGLLLAGSVALNFWYYTRWQPKR